MQWYYAESGRQAGPVDDEAFRGLVASGRIASDTLVWSPGMANWQPYQTVYAGVATMAGAPPLPSDGDMQFCSECGRPYPHDDLVVFGSSLVCASCKPIFTQKLREGVVPVGALQYGGFWMRFLAVFIDGLILAVVSMFYSPFITFGGFDPRDTARVFVMFGILTGIGFLVRMVYETWFIGRFGATPGKMVCHLKVVRPDGRPLTYQRSLGRFFGKLLNDFTFLIGYIIAAFDDEKRALHDRVCDTRVVRS
jgi:uncharacterized RDD family membrane protein YckC